MACGLGRNAFFLAGLGFTVDAVDISDVAVSAVARREGRQDLASEHVPVSRLVAGYPQA